MVPQTKSSPRNPLHPDISERALEPNEERQEVDIADAGLSSAEAWYYVVDCASCKAAIPFKHAPEGEAILRLPTMRVRCFQCSAVHTYATGLISHRKAAAPRGIVRRDQPAKTPDNAQGVPRDRQEDCGDRGTEGREITERKTVPSTSSFQRASGVIAALSGNSATIFFLSSCLFAIGLSFQLALNTFYPVPIAELAEAHSYGPAVLLDGAHFGAILCALALFIFGTGSVFICGSNIGAIRKKVTALAKTNAFMQSFLKWINVSAKKARFTSLSRQVTGAHSPRPRSPP